MANAQQIPGTEAAWDSGALGENPDTARVVSKEKTAEIEDAIGLQSISIRLPKSLINNFKLIARIHGMGYQPLMRETLNRFAQEEMNILLADYASRLKQEQASAEHEAEAEQHLTRQAA